MKLTVEKISRKDAWKDVVRIPHAFRKDDAGNGISRGTICRIGVNGRSRLVAVHGSPIKQPIIQIDSPLRHKLNVKIGELYDFQLEESSWVGSLLWTWKASEPAYRVPAQISLISFVLGVIGLILGIISLRH